MKKVFFSTCFLFLILISVSATNYYVSKEGNDANDGSKGAPFLTLVKASTRLFAGDTCFIMEGTYRETLTAVRSGTADSPIVFKAYGSDSVVISATEVLDGWSQHEGNIYKTGADMSLGRQNMLYFNGKAMDWARWPNNEDDDRFTIDASAIEGGSASTVVDNAIPNMDWVGGYMWYLGAHSGTSWTRVINNYDPASHTVYFDAVDINKWPFNPHNPTVFRNGNRGRIFLFGTMDALDYPGEWYFDSVRDSLYFQAPANVAPAASSTEIAARSTTIQLTASYIHVDGINAFGGRIFITGNNCVVKNGTFRHCLEILDELNNTDAQMGDGSIKIEGSNTLVENNTIEYGSSNGIAMLAAWKGNTNNTIKNNTIRYFNTIGIHSGCLRSNNSSTKVLGNSIYSCGRDGVYMSGVNSELAYNDIYDCMKINNDGGVFYTVGSSNSKNTKIHHNWCHDSFGPEYADGRAAGIYLDNDSKGYDVHHNVVWNVTWTAVQMNWDNWYNDIFNNSFWDVGGAMGSWLNGRELIDNRIYNNYSSVGPWIGNEFKNNIIDPNSPFQDESMMEFTPRQGSVLIDAGIYIQGITNQVMGKAPDVGAYEYGLSPWRPGRNHLAGGDTLSNLEINILQPLAEQIFAFPADVSVEAENVNNEKGVRLVLYLDDVFISEIDTPPYKWDPAHYPALSQLPVGLYVLKIIAADMNDFTATALSSFSVVAGSVGDQFQLGNPSNVEGTMDVWTSNMVINKRAFWTNQTDSIIYLRTGAFSFYAQALADPVTPFIVRVNGEDDFTVISVGDSRSKEAYIKGENQFSFRDAGDTTLLVLPGETIASGFLDAKADGSGGGLGSVIPYNEEDPRDNVWYTGGPSPYQSGSVFEGLPPVYDVPPRTYYLRNYHYNIEFTIADTVETDPSAIWSAGLMGFSLYPNPVIEDHFSIRISGAEGDYTESVVSIFDLSGKVIYTGAFNGSSILLQGGVLPGPGTYLVKVASGGQIKFRKLIKL